MLKLKPVNWKQCKGFYTRDINEQKDSKCFKCGRLRDDHKNDLAYLLRNKKGVT